MKTNCKWAVIAADQTIAVFQRAAVAEDFIEQCIPPENRPTVRIDLIGE